MSIRVAGVDDMLSMQVCRPFLCQSKQANGCLSSSLRTFVTQGCFWSTSVVVSFLPSSPSSFPTDIVLCMYIPSSSSWIALQFAVPARELPAQILPVSCTHVASGKKMYCYSRILVWIYPPPSSSTTRANFSPPHRFPHICSVLKSEEPQISKDRQVATGDDVCTVVMCYLILFHIFCSSLFLI